MDGRLTHITIVDKPIHKLLPGEATLAFNGWYIGCPICCLRYYGEDGPPSVNNLSGHDATYDAENKVLTISPSILCGCGAHYFIERNQIRWC